MVNFPRVMNRKDLRIFVAFDNRQLIGADHDYYLFNLNKFTPEAENARHGEDFSSDPKERI